MAMKKVLVNFIQDRSGSMSSVWDETLNGFKKFVEDLQTGVKEDDIEYLFSLTTFNTVIDTPIVAKPVSEVNLGALANFGPRGSTALYDAVGKTIQNVDTDRHGAEKIIVVIVTDGQENSSREWSKDALHKSIESHLNAGDWTFTYLGTQPETWDDAMALGVGVGAVASYQPTKAAAAYTATAGAVRGMSVSSSLGSRNLMVDHLSPTAERSAGMHVHRDQTGPAPAAPLPRSPRSQSKPDTKPTNRRWR
jgi:uncharacterized protein YegL